MDIKDEGDGTFTGCGSNLKLARRLRIKNIAPRAKDKGHFLRSPHSIKNSQKALNFSRNSQHMKVVKIKMPQSIM